MAICRWSTAADAATSAKDAAERQSADAVAEADECRRQVEQLLVTIQQLTQNAVTANTDNESLGGKVDDLRTQADDARRQCAHVTKQLEEMVTDTFMIA